MYMVLNLDLANEICDEVSREICLSSICSIKAVYLRQLNTGNSLFVISSSIDLFLQVGDWDIDIVVTRYYYYCCRQYRRNIDGELMCNLIYSLQKSHLKTQHGEMGRAWLRQLMSRAEKLWFWSTISTILADFLH